MRCAKYTCLEEIELSEGPLCEICAYEFVELRPKKIDEIEDEIEALSTQIKNLISFKDRLHRSSSEFGIRVSDSSDFGRYVLQLIQKKSNKRKESLKALYVE